MMAVLSGMLLAAVIPASSAVAYLSSPATWDVTVQQPLALQAKGAAVSVPLQVTCPAGSYAHLDVSLTQRSGSTVVSGSVGRDVTCTGSPESRTLNVVSSVGSRVFKKGPVFVEAVLYGCGYACGVMDTDSGTMEISR